MAPVVTLPMTIAAVLAGLVGAAVATVVARRRGQVDLRSVLAALASAAAVGGLALLWTGTLPSGQIRWGFTAMHLVYLGATISLPLVGGALLVLRIGRGGGRIALVIGVVLLVPAPIGVYATHIEPHWLRVDEVAVPVRMDRAGSDPVRIGVLADYQTASVGAHERASVDAVLAAEPDLIVVPGDIFQGTAAELDVLALADAS